MQEGPSLHLQTADNIDEVGNGSYSDKQSTERMMVEVLIYNN